MARKKAKTLLNVSFLLDKTGSMGSVAKATISGFNQYVDSLKSRADEIRFTLALFNSDGTDTLYKGVSLADVKPLDSKSYDPVGATPLYDAVAATIRATEQSLNGKKEEVLVIIMTDGEENSSEEFTREKVFDLIKGKEAEGWTFAFLGANQDSWGVGESIGVAVADSAMDYDATKPKQAFAAASMATSDYLDNPSEAKQRGVFSRYKSQNS